MIKAVWNVNTGKKVYISGDEIPAKELSKEDKAELIKKGAIEEVEDETPAEDNDNPAGNVNEDTDK